MDEGAESPTEEPPVGPAEESGSEVRRDGSPGLGYVIRAQEAFADSPALRSVIGVQKAFADSPALSSVIGVQKAFADSPALRSVIGAHKAFADSPALRSVIGAHKAFADSPALRSVIGAQATLMRAAAPSRSDWEELLEDVRDPIGPDLYDETLSALDSAGGHAREDDGATWWLARLPFVVQVGLLMVVLQALDALGQSVVDLAGEELPTEYENGARILFAMAGVLYAFVAACADHRSAADAPES